MRNSFAERYAVVTGAAQGIGFGMAKRFVEDGIKGVAILDWNIEAAAEAAKQLEAMGSSKVIALKCDVSNYAMVSEVMSKIEADFGQIDILVNNAGITTSGMFHKMTEQDWLKVIGVNLNGLFNCSRAVINGMRDRNYGRIVNIASRAAYGEVGHINYCASKAAVIGFTKALAVENARKGITCNSISPDFVDTPMMNDIPEENMANRLKNAPMQRMGSTAEVAALVAFLASDDSSYVTGTNIDCNGGTRT